LTQVTESDPELLFDRSPDKADTPMRSRLLHAISAFAGFMLLAACYGVLTARPVDLLRVALWSAAGIGAYIALSHAFGFDPHRTKVASIASDWVHYVDRWELRLGQATLSMLGLMVVAARLFDELHFVSAVVSATLSAWSYFACRLYLGGYDARRGARRAAS
jgi:hypothetical protein